MQNKNLTEKFKKPILNGSLEWGNDSDEEIVDETDRIEFRV